MAKTKASWKNIVIHLGMALPYIWISLVPTSIFNTGRYSTWPLTFGILVFAFFAQWILAKYFRQNPDTAKYFSHDWMRTMIVFLAFFIGMQSVTHIIQIYEPNLHSNSKYNWPTESAGLILAIILGGFSGALTEAHRRLLGLPSEDKPKPFGEFFLTMSKFL